MFKSIINEFNRRKIRYTILRVGKDIDISVHKDDWQKISVILRRRGFIKGIQNFNKNHISFRNEEIGFDIRHLDDWNGIFYLDESIYKNRILKDGIYYLCDGDMLAHYIFHSLLGKRDWRYKSHIQDLLKKVDSKFIINRISKIYSQNKATTLVEDLEIDTFPKYHLFLFEAIIGNFWAFTKTFISWIKWKFTTYPLIAIIGPDGSGKSTLAANLASKIESFRYPVKAIYSGRGNKNVLPMKSVGRVIKKRPKWLYLPYSVLSFIDMFFRYNFYIRQVRMKKIVVTDRCYLDLLTLKHIPHWLRKFYLFFFPRPSKIFYLYNNLEELKKRRPNHNPEDLVWQMHIFNQLNGKVIRIKTDDEKNTLKLVLQNIF